MKKRRAFGVVATVLVAVLAVTQASALGSASEGGLMPSEIGQTNDEILMEALANPDLTPEQKEQVKEKWDLTDRLASEGQPSTRAGSTAVLNVDAVMQEDNTKCAPATVQQILKYIKKAHSSQTVPSQTTIQNCGWARAGYADGIELFKQNAKQKYLTFAALFLAKRIF